MSADEASPSATGAGGDIWSVRADPRAIASELHHIEKEIRLLLEPFDIKKKRRVDGTRRCLELEEDLIQMRHASRSNDSAIRKILALLARRQRLFQTLRFVVTTRHGWNT